MSLRVEHCGPFTTPITHAGRWNQDIQLLYKKSRCVTQVSCHRGNAGEGVESWWSTDLGQTLTSFKLAKTKAGCSHIFLALTSSYFLMFTLASWLQFALFSVLILYWTELQTQRYRKACFISKILFTHSSTQPCPRRGGRREMGKSLLNQTLEMVRIRKNNGSVP